MLPSRLNSFAGCVEFLDVGGGKILLRFISGTAALGTATFVFVHVAAAQQTTTATPSKNLLGGDAQAASSTMSDRGKILRYTEKLLERYVEYNPGTCAQVSSGSWTVNVSPKYGTVRTGTTTGTLVSGACPGTIFTFGTIFYTWTAHNNKSATDSFSATYTSPSFTVPTPFSVSVPVVRPDHETTIFTGWHRKGPGNWKQTLYPPASDPGFDFSGEQVTEKDAGGAADSCWFSGSIVKKTTGLFGGSWPVTSGNTWGPDSVGFTTAAIDYYRKQGRAPCAATVLQQMTIQSPADRKPAQYGAVNTLQGLIGKKSITSIRAGKRAVGNQ